MLAPAMVAGLTSTTTAGETTTAETGLGLDTGTEAALAMAMVISGTSSVPAEEATPLLGEAEARLEVAGATR